MGVMSAPGTISAHQAQMASQQGFNERVFVIEVKNAGRSPTTITDVSVRYGNGATYTETNQTRLRLEAESEESRYFPAEVIERTAQVMSQAATKGAFEVRGYVRVAGRDKPVLSKNKLTL
ncbi:MAG TPA: hypothetical protein VGP17_14645 [Solirubrobacteraceae bacterium]|nr:hypothetical protein [Solirubrobacteraceae bacterium]